MLVPAVGACGAGVAVGSVCAQRLLAKANVNKTPTAAVQARAERRLCLIIIYLILGFSEEAISLVATRKRLGNRQTLLGTMTTCLSQRRFKVGPDFPANRLLTFC